MKMLMGYLGSRNEGRGPKASFHLVLSLALSVTAGGVFVNITLLTW